MSSGVCKKLEGAVFPFQVEALEDGINDTVYAGYVDKANHRSSSPANFYETTLDEVGGTQLPPQPPGQGEEGQQFGKIALQAPHHGTIVAMPARPEAAKGSYRLSSDWMGYAGYLYRKDSAEFATKSGTASAAGKNSTVEIQGNYINLLLEVSF